MNVTAWVEILHPLAQAENILSLTLCCFISVKLGTKPTHSVFIIVMPLCRITEYIIRVSDGL